MVNAVTKSKKIIYDFPTCVKLGVGSAWGLTLFDANPYRHQHGNRIRIGIKPMPIHNTAGTDLIDRYLVCYVSKLCNVHYLTVKWLAASSLVTKDRSCSVIRTAHLPDKKINTWCGRYHNQGFGSAFIWYVPYGSGSSILGWIPIRIPDPDPIQIQGFNDQKFKKINSWKKN